MTREEFLLILNEKYAKKNTLLSYSSAAWNKFLKMELPTKINETYTYTRLNPLYATPLSESEASSLTIRNESKALIDPIVKALTSFSSYLNKHLDEAVNFSENPFSLVAYALSDHAYFIYIPPKVKLSTPIYLDHLIKKSAGASFSNLHIHLFASAESSAEIIFRTHAEDRFAVNEAIDLHLDSSAKVKFHLLSLFNKKEGWHTQSVKAQLKKESVLQICHHTNGASSSIANFSIALQEEKAQCDIYSLASLHEKQDANVIVKMKHEARETISNQLIKSIGRDDSHFSFNGKIVVDSLALLTEAYQKNNNLLCSEYAKAESKPNLEIFADDVKASHGATFGRLQEEELHYLMTRGISKKSAEELLIHAFQWDVLQHFSEYE